jgi:hypothetical protein
MAYDRNFAVVFITLLLLLNPEINEKMPTSVPDVFQNDIFGMYIPTRYSHILGYFFLHHTVCLKMHFHEEEILG